MSRLVLYVAAPLRPTEEEIAAVKAIHGQAADHPTSALRLRQALVANLDRAMSWRVFDGDDGEPMRFNVYVLTKLGAEPPAYERDPVTTMEFELWVKIGMQQYEGSR